MSDLKSRLLKNTTVKLTAELHKSVIYNKKSVITTRVPMINAAFSGDIYGGIPSGLTIFAGPSKHFKSGFTLLTASAFLESRPNGIVLFYDTEFGTPASYFASLDVDPERVVHTPITNIEEFKFDIMNQLTALGRDDDILIMVDSVGNMASKKEVDDAINENTAADMTRAKQLKSVFRMVTPHLSIKDIPMIAVNHTYKTQEMYSKDQVSGGTGIYYSADNIFIIGRQQDKDGTVIQGYNFVLNVEKSRYVKEKSKIPINVLYQGGINVWSGLLENALEGGYIAKPKVGWYQVVDRSTGEMVGTSFRESQIVSNADFWKNILTTTDLPKYIQNKYSIPSTHLLEDDKDIKDAMESIEDEY